MKQMNSRKAKQSSSHPMIAGLIRMKSVDKGLRFPLDVMVEQKRPDDQASKCATRASKVMNGLAATIASQLSNAKESEIEHELDVKDLTEVLIRDEELWKEFRKKLADSKILTNLGVNEILSQFVAENKSRIERRQKDAAVMESSKKPQGMMERAMGMTGMTAVVSSERTGVQRSASDSVMKASPVKRTIHRLSLVSFQISPSLSDQCQDPSDKLQCSSEPPTRHSTSFDSDHWDAMRHRRMSLDPDIYRRILSRGTSIGSSELRMGSTSKNSSLGSAEENPKSSSSVQDPKNHENTSRISLLKKLASSINPSTKKDRNVEEDNVCTNTNLVQTLRINRIWNKEARTKKRCSFTVEAKPSSIKEVPISRISSASTVVSPSIMSGMEPDMPSFKRGEEHEANDSVRIDLSGVSSSNLNTCHSLSCTKHINITDEDVRKPIVDIKSTTDETPFVTNENNNNKGSFESTFSNAKQASTTDILMKEQVSLKPYETEIASTIFVERRKEKEASFAMQFELKSSQAPTELQTIYF